MPRQEGGGGGGMVGGRHARKRVSVSCTLASPPLNLKNRIDTSTGTISPLRRSTWICLPNGWSDGRPVRKPSTSSYRYLDVR